MHLEHAMLEPTLFGLKQKVRVTDSLHTTLRGCRNINSDGQTDVGQFSSVLRVVVTSGSHTLLDTDGCFWQVVCHVGPNALVTTLSVHLVTTAAPTSEKSRDAV